MPTLALMKAKLYQKMRGVGQNAGKLSPRY